MRPRTRLAVSFFSPHSGSRICITSPVSTSPAPTEAPGAGDPPSCGCRARSRPWLRDRVLRPMELRGSRPLRAAAGMVNSSARAAIPSRKRSSAMNSGICSNKSWLFRFERKGHERQMGLGSLQTIGLGEAREEAGPSESSCLRAATPSRLGTVSKPRRTSPRRKRSRPIGAPRATWRPTRRAGAMPNIGSSGTIRSQLTPLRSSASCRWSGRSCRR
jgi:hypothetical protein